MVYVVKEQAGGICVHKTKETPRRKKKKKQKEDYENTTGCRLSRRTGRIQAQFKQQQDMQLGKAFQKS